jgi:HAD superfamily hydrolase (TIGR01509 family)
MHLPERNKNIWSGIRAVILDMDGLLVDSEPIHWVTLNRVLAEYGHRVDEEENSGYVGQPEVETWRMVMGKRGISADLQELSRKRARVFSEILRTEGIPVMPGAMDLVKACKEKGYPLAIATSTPRGTVVEVLAASGFDREVEIVASAYDPEVKHGKPAPDVFLRAATLLGVEPANCLVFEDSGLGIQAAKAAGMRCVAVPGSHVKESDKGAADLVLKSLVDMVRPPGLDP